MNLEIKNSSVVIKLNKVFYNFDTVKSSLEDYSELMVAEVNYDDVDNIILELIPKNLSLLPQIGQEFCNYVFAKMKNQQLI
ncbi:MAG: hypothetical protein U9R08_04260 [Nanoarchaeota archaeon]|nr:hypothetical protein [Nanoarchaeota archaeon]